jgi:hypothetical protein
MMPEDVFVDTLEDLRRRCDLRATPYDMLQASGLMRRLLIEQLWVPPNRQIEHKPVFRIREAFVCASTEKEHGVTAWVPGLLADPELTSIFMSRYPSVDPPDAPPQALKASKFLKWKIVHASVGGRKESVTVHELTKHFANTQGGVHFDRQGKSASAPLDRLPLQAESPLLYTLVALGRITVKALEPIASAILLRRLPGQVGGTRYEEETTAR